MSRLEFWQHTLAAAVVGGTLTASGCGGQASPTAQANGVGPPTCVVNCIVEFILPEPGHPFALVTGPDGAIWFGHEDNVGRISREGQVKTFEVPSPHPLVGWITVGPDRAMWFAERQANKIGRITVQGAVREYSVPSTGPGPRGELTSLPQALVALNSDLWFTEEWSNKIGRTTLKGEIIEYPVPTANSHPLGLVGGADGALWFVEKQVDKIGRVTVDGRITEYPITAGSLPQRIVSGADKALWFSEARSGKIGRMTTDGRYTEYAAPGFPVGLIAAPDGGIYFVEYNANKIGRMDTRGRITNEWSVPTDGAAPLQITLGPDRNIWFSETGNNNKIARLQLRSQ